jgi:hypothetical protein
MDIRDEDRGYRTRVFKITSVTLASKLDMCIGQRYEEGDADRYNVYSVSDGAVGGLIGYYDVPRDTAVLDDSNDFHVERFGEPTWINTLKRVNPPKPKESNPIVVAKSLFKVVITQSDGDCFYDTIVRALENLDDYTKATYDVSKTNELRKRLSDYIKTNRTEDLIARYKVCSVPNTIRYDSNYVKYWDMCLDDPHAKKNRVGKKLTFDEVKKIVKSDIEKDPSLRDKIDPDLISKSTNLGDPSPNDISDEGCGDFLDDYFEGNDEIFAEDEIVDTFIASLNTPNVWANDFTILSLEMMDNLKIIPLTKTGNKVEDYNVINDISPIVPNRDTRYVLTEYDGRHYKLIKTDKSIFTMKDLPDVIKRKCEKFDWFKKVESMPNPLPSNPLPTLPAKPAKPAPESIDGKLAGMTIPQLKEYAKENNIRYNSSITKKTDIIDCIKDPELPKCKPKTKKGGFRTSTNTTRRL